MKKYSLCILAALFLQYKSIAQTAPDFTITTTDSITRNLYNTLSQGKTVVLDFFYPTCQGCWYYSPIIEQAYQLHGAGTGNVEFWGINGGVQLVNDAAVIAYKTQYGITNPSASALEGNGKYVDSLYRVTFPSFFSYPMYAVVCPDRHIYLQVNYPPVANGFDVYINDSCGASSSSVIEQNSSANVSVFPNPSINSIQVQSILSPIIAYSIYDLSGRLQRDNALNGNTIYREELPAGTYLVKLELADGAIVERRIVFVD
jgi:hypothetical protein